MASSTQKLLLEIQIKNQQALGRLEQEVNKVSRSSQLMGTALKAALGFLTIQFAANAVRSLVKVGNEMQSLTLRFKFLYGSAQEGAKAFQVLTDYASQVPFTLEEIQQAAGNLAVVTDDADDLAEILKITGNVAAVTGIDFKTAGEQLQRSFSGGIAAADIFREKGVRNMLGFKEGATVSVAQTIAAFKRVFGAGGQFGKATDEFAKTLAGQVSMVQDKFRKFQEAIVVGFFGELERAVGDTNKFLQDNEENIKEFGKVVGEELAGAIRKLGEAIKFTYDNWILLETVIGALLILAPGLKSKLLGVIALGDALNKGLFKDLERQDPNVFNEVYEGLTSILDADDGLADANYNLSNSFLAVQEVAKNYVHELSEVNEKTQQTITQHKTLEQAVRKAFDEQVNKGISDYKGNLEKLLENYTLASTITSTLTNATNTFARTTESALTDVIMGTKTLKEALGEIGQAILRDLIGGFIRLLIVGPILQKLADLFGINMVDATQKQIDKEKQLNRELQKQAGLRLLLMVLGGFADGGKIGFGGKADGGKIGFGGFRAGGGSTSTGSAYVVGERGPELFVPNTAGTVIPNNRMNSSMGEVNINFNIQAVDAESFDDLLMSRKNLIVGTVSQALKQNGRRLA